MIHRNYKIIGKVQGVFFRQSSHEKALALGLNGFVRNEADGSVHLEAEGEPEALEKLEQWLRQGPPQARVEEVQSSEAGLSSFEGFEVRR